MSVKICNLALVALGANPIMSMTEDCEEARKLNLIYVSIVKDLLRAHPWNFASDRSSLAQLSEKPPFGFSFYYQLPTNCLRAIEVNENPQINFVVEGRKLLCDEETVDLKYVAYIKDSTQYDPNFVTLLAARLAAEIAYPITQSRTVSKDRWDIYLAMEKTSRSSDAQEGRPQRTESIGWVVGRS